MTIEEAIEILKEYELNPCVPEDREAIDMAIEALEREKNPNSIRINFVGEEEAEEFNEYLKNQQESILDKIKAEIDELDVLRFSSGERIYKDEVLDIIDKYKTESEENEV